MRLNQFLARHTDLSRRSADQAIAEGRVEINGTPAKLGDVVIASDRVTLDGHLVEPAAPLTTIMLNKPTGYVCSRQGQGSQTVYDLLPKKLHHLNPVGRLDKDSSGLLLMTNDGSLANELTHPRYQKTKIYLVELDKELQTRDGTKLRKGVSIGDDRPSKLEVTQHWVGGAGNRLYRVAISEGRNRQIRRSFAALGYKVTSLHRISFGPYTLGTLKPGAYKPLSETPLS